MRRARVALLLSPLLFLGVLLLSVYATVRATAPIREDVRLSGVQVVKDGFVSAYVLELGEREVALVDAGDDPSARAILLALARRGLGPEAVKLILLTHGDTDHVGGAVRFPGAQVMALGPDVALAEGRERRGPMRLLAAKPTGLHVARALSDGERLPLPEAPVQVFAVPGHTPGSAAYLARGVLFLGDSCELRRDRKLTHGWWFTNSDTAGNDASLLALAARLRGKGAEVRAVACGHSAVAEQGLDPIPATASR